VDTEPGEILDRSICGKFQLRGPVWSREISPDESLQKFITILGDVISKVEMPDGLWADD